MTKIICESGINQSLTGMVIGYDDQLACTNMRRRLRKLGYDSTEFRDVQAPYALLIGGRINGGGSCQSS